jgi:hypothetical protein
MKLSDQKVTAEFQKAGFALSKGLDILPYQCFLFLERPGEDRGWARR